MNFRIHEKGLPKYRYPNILQYEHRVGCRVSSLPSSYVHAVVEKACKHALGHCQNFPISRFCAGWSEHLHPLLRGVHMATILLGRAEQWAATVSYSIGIVGGLLEGGADPKDWNCIGISPLYQSNDTCLSLLYVPIKNWIQFISEPLHARFHLGRKLVRYIHQNIHWW